MGSPKLLRPVEVYGRKLLLVSHDAHFYGGQLLALHLVRTLRQEFGFEVVTLLLGAGPLRAEFEKLGEVVGFTDPDWRTHASAAVTKARLKRLKTLHQRGFRYAICNTTASGCVLPILGQASFRSLVLVHELPNLLRQYNLEDAAKDVGALADVVVFPAAFVRDRFLSVAPVDPRKTVIRPQGLFRLNPHLGKRATAKEAITQSLGLVSTTRLVIGAGPADRRKGVDLFCQTAALVSRLDPAVHFVWIGDEDNDLAGNCKDWLKVFGIADRVHFIGVIQDPELYAQRIASADVFLMSSREDPYPSVVLDAMTLGIPVVAFAEAGGFSELLEEGAGLTVPMEDVVAMSESLFSLLNDTTRAESIGRTGQAIIASRFGFKDYVGDLLRLLGADQTTSSADAGAAQTIQATST